MEFDAFPAVVLLEYGHSGYTALSDVSFSSYEKCSFCVGFQAEDVY